MLFLQFVQYSSSFVGTLKNEIPGAALELCRLKIKQFSPDILKFRRKHEDNPFTLNCYMIPRTFLFYFMQASGDWVLLIFGTQVIKNKRPVWPVLPDYLSVSYDWYEARSRVLTICFILFTHYKRASFMCVLLSKHGTFINHYQAHSFRATA